MLLVWSNGPCTHICLVLLHGVVKYLLVDRWKGKAAAATDGYRPVKSSINTRQLGVHTKSTIPHYMEAPYLPHKPTLSTAAKLPQEDGRYRHGCTSFRET